MKDKLKKTFKCDDCKGILKVFRINQFGGIIDTRKYINKKIVCERCFNLTKEENRLGTKLPRKKPGWFAMVGFNIK